MFDLGRKIGVEKTSQATGNVMCEPETFRA